MYLERSSSSSRFTQFSSLHHKENISDMYNHECVLYHCIIVSCMIVLLVRGVRGDCSGPVTGIVRGYPRRGRTLSAPCPRPRLPVLGCYHPRPGTLTPHTGHDHSYEHRGPGQAEVPRPGVNSSVLQLLHQYSI